MLANPNRTYHSPLKRRQRLRFRRNRFPNQPRREQKSNWLLVNFIGLHRAKLFRKERECLAVVWALRTLYPYLIYEQFTVFTDHFATHWLINVIEPSARLTRWRLRLVEVSLDITDSCCKENHIDDAMSGLYSSEGTVMQWR